MSLSVLLMKWGEKAIEEKCSHKVSAAGKVSGLSKSLKRERDNFALFFFFLFHVLAGSP